MYDRNAGIKHGYDPTRDQIETMSSKSQEFKVGDSVLIVGTNHDGELGTVIAIAAGSDGQRYLIVFENGNRSAFNVENLSHRR